MMKNKFFKSWRLVHKISVIFIRSFFKFPFFVSEIQIAFMKRLQQKDVDDVNQRPSRRNNRFQKRLYLTTFFYPPSYVALGQALIGGFCIQM